MMTFEYPFITSVLPEAEGGGYLIEYPDLPGCMSDGDTIREAIENGRDAVRCWIEIARVHGGMKFPRWVHQFEHEGVSLNGLAISLLAEGLGRKAAFSSEYEPQP